MSELITPGGGGDPPPGDTLDLSGSSVLLTEGACFKAPNALLQPRQRPRPSRPAVRLSHDLVHLFRQCNPCFFYDPESRPKRYLTVPHQPVANQQRDNTEKDLIVWMGKHIVDESTGTEYWIRSLLGCGTFGQVLRAMNMRTKEACAIKIIKNDPSYYNQSQTEVRMLQLLNAQFRGEEDGVHVVKLLSRFDYANHLCLVFEILRENLFEVLESNGYKGLSLNTVKPIVHQVLTTLTACSRAGIVHCDLKPENILMVKPPYHVKLIDFGSACEEHNTVYSYIQSRYYRAPEVLLGVDYTCMIDMWSLGCVAAELFLGLPLLPGCNDYNQMYRIVEMVGFPPKHLLDEGTKTLDYFKRLDKLNGAAADDDDDDPDPPAPPPTQPGKRAPLPPPKILPSHGYKLKSEAQYYADAGEARQPFKRYFYYHKLSEIVLLYSWPKEIRQCEDAEEKARLQQEEKKRRSVFIDFLHGLLHTDPRERWPAAVALKHPFITGEKYGGDGTFHIEVALPEIQAKRNARMKSRSLSMSAVYPGATPSNNSLPVPVSAWGASTPIDMQRGLVSPSQGFGGMSVTPSSSLAQSPVPAGYGYESMPSPMPQGMGFAGQSSLGTSFPGASMAGSFHMGTPTSGQRQGAQPIPIPHTSSGSDAFGSSLPGSSFQNSWMESSYVAASTFNSHSSPPVPVPQGGLGTSPSQPMPIGRQVGQQQQQQQQHHHRGKGFNRAKRVDSTHGQNGSTGCLPMPGTSPSMSIAPPSYTQAGYAGRSQTQGHSHGTPTSSFPGQAQSMMQQQYQAFHASQQMQGGARLPGHPQGQGMAGQLQQQMPMQQQQAMAGQQQQQAQQQGMQMQQQMQPRQQHGGEWGDWEDGT